MHIYIYTYIYKNKRRGVKFQLRSISQKKKKLGFSATHHQMLSVTFLKIQGEKKEKKQRNLVVPL